MISILAVIFTFSVVIFFHELGHFLIAKKLGIWVKKFSLGFGPELFGRTIGETRYRLSLIPLGGYVKMAGEDPEEERQGVPTEFLSQAWWRRILVVVAGPAMNFLLTIILFSVVFYIWGKPQVVEESIIGEVLEGTPAQKAGLEKGDKIISIEGKKISEWKEIVEIIHPAVGETLKIRILRENKEIDFLITPQLDKERKVGLIGIAAKVEMEKIGFFSSVIEGARQTIIWSIFILKSISQVFLRMVKPAFAGPLGIGHLVAKTAKTGMENLLYLIGLISLNIGLFNLFPIPILDGGHVMLYLWEGFTGKPLDVKKMRVAQIVGLSILVFILVLAMQSDIMRWRNGWGN